ncbi:MAG: HyaD/HybD family hydrogenase maturation endopeptidase [Myxococcales bacterium]|nr:HyaD/HybD family hydrogenase maturation endopeptidase [Myxococcales bacterium]
MSERTPALVMGIGNLLWADEGFGLRCLESLHLRFDVPAGVELLDGGTQGMYLVNAVADAERLLVFDAIDYGLAPGTLKLVRDDEVPRFAGVRKMSLHQTGFQEVLLAAAMLEKSPAKVTLVGVQLGTMDDFGGTLSQAVAAALEPALEAGVDELAAWGFPLTRRAAPAAHPVFAQALARDRYEQERPGPDVVCREGDARFLNVRAKRLGE